MNDPDVEKFKRIFSWVQGIILIIMAIFVILATYSYIGLTDCDAYCDMTYGCTMGEYEKYAHVIFVVKNYTDAETYALCNISRPVCFNFSNINFSEKDEWES